VNPVQKDLSLAGSEESLTKSISRLGSWWVTNYSPPQSSG